MITKQMFIAFLSIISKLLEFFSKIWDYIIPSYLEHLIVCMTLRRIPLRILAALQTFAGQLDVHQFVDKLSNWHCSFKEHFLLPL